MIRLRIATSSGDVDPNHPHAGFAFDNEAPLHERIVEPFELASHLVTNADYLEFIAAGGYDQAKYWLSDAWATVDAERWTAPVYWRLIDNKWHHYTLHGLVPLDPSEPVSHVSFYEAQAFAQWAGARLPTEFEWELAASDIAPEGNLLDILPATAPDPMPAKPAADGETQLQQMFGDVWEWTQSPYTSYPGFKPLSGNLGEYNGKFMCNQMVMRGGSCATPRDHIRHTYRNFFFPQARWQFSGIRLARDS